MWNNYLHRKLLTKKAASDIVIEAYFMKNRTQKSRWFYESGDNNDRGTIETVSEETEERFVKMVFDVTIDKIVSKLDF